MRASMQSLFASLSAAFSSIPPSPLFRRLGLFFLLFIPFVPLYRLGLAARPALAAAIRSKGAMATENGASNGQQQPHGRKKKIAIMTSGGDSPGMNAVVRACVRMAINDNCDAYCVYEGYEGLVQGGKYIRKMDWYDVRGWLSEGGTLIGTARCMAFFQRAGRLAAAKNMILEGIDALIICGGDGSLTGADLFRQEWPGLLEELVATGQLTQDQIAPHQHLNIVGLVGSIDNDLTGTDATIGAYSSLARICDAVDLIDSTAQSHSRAFVIEVMGRHCGWLALMAGVATGADFIFIPEKPREDNWKEEMCNIVHHHRKLGKRKTIVIIAEGALDRHGSKISSEMVKDLLADKNGLGLDTRITTLGHVQRGGSAVAYDRMLGTLQGAEAVKAVLEADPDTRTCFIAINENKIVRKPLMEAVLATKEVAKAIQSQKFDVAMSLRDHDFAEHYKSFMMTTAVQMDSKLLVPAEKRLKMGIINVGAPAGGMNAAMRAAVAYCMSRGHEPVAIHNGFAGFIRHYNDMPLGSVRPFNWLEVDNWATRGGSEIGTNREVPGKELPKVAELIARFELKALFLIGGFEAFTAMSELRKGRELYPSLCIPITLLPATISNNVPGSEYSLGSDTALNELVNYCDKMKQSASATRRRVFVIETQGGRCGYLATMAGLDVGAIAVYTPENGVSLKALFRDVNHVKYVFKKDTGQSRAGRLVLINEKASDVYSAKLIASILRDESGGRFEAREGVPGHLQQGGVPSAMDRCRAVRLAIRCIQQIENFAGHTEEEIRENPMSASVIGIKGAKVVFTDMQTLESDTVTDWPNRRPVHHHWSNVKDILDILGGKARNSHQPEDNDEDEPSLTGTLAKDVKRGLTNV